MLRREIVKLKELFYEFLNEKKRNVLKAGRYNQIYDKLNADISVALKNLEDDVMYAERVLEDAKSRLREEKERLLKMQQEYLKNLQDGELKKDEKFGTLLLAQHISTNQVKSAISSLTGKPCEVKVQSEGFFAFSTGDEDFCFIKSEKLNSLEDVDKINWFSVYASAKENGNNYGFSKISRAHFQLGIRVELPKMIETAVEEIMKTQEVVDENKPTVNLRNEK